MFVFLSESFFYDKKINFLCNIHYASFESQYQSQDDISRNQIVCE